MVGSNVLGTVSTTNSEITSCMVFINVTVRIMILEIIVISILVLVIGTNSVFVNSKVATI